MFDVIVCTLIVLQNNNGCINYLLKNIIHSFFKNKLKYLSFFSLKKTIGIILALLRMQSLASQTGSSTICFDNFHFKINDLPT